MIKNSNRSRFSAVSIAIVLCLLGILLPNAQSKPTLTQPELIWSRSQTEIEAPSFSPDGKEIVLTIKPHDLMGMKLSRTAKLSSKRSTIAR